MQRVLAVLKLLVRFSVTPTSESPNPLISESCTVMVVDATPEVSVCAVETNVTAWCVLSALMVTLPTAEVSPVFDAVRVIA